ARSGTFPRVASIRASRNRIHYKRYERHFCKPGRDRLARSYKDKDIKLLWGLAAARCAFPKCRHPLILDETETDPMATIGQMAHIIAHSPAVVAPRSDPNFDEALRDAYENLILLCDTHHATVD